jgi:phenylacetic acid degradation operon negative regulatory protein
MLAPGLLAHPAADPAPLAEILERVKGTGKVFVCSAAELPDAGSRPLGELVREGWDLSRVVADYRRFIDEFTPLLAVLREESALTPESAFVVRSLLIHAYRRVQLHDPMLPLELLPQPWPGSEAYALAQAIYRLTWQRAETHLMDVLRKEDADAPEADAGFYDRFGGLR